MPSRVRNGRPKRAALSDKNRSIPVRRLDKRMLLCCGLQGRGSGRRPPVSSLRLYPEGVIRAVWQGKLEALKALTMDSALAAVKAAEIVRENGSSAWKNAVPGRRLLFLGFSFCGADFGGSIKGLPAFCSRLEAVCCQKTFGELEKAEPFRIFKHIRQRVGWGQDNFLRRKGSFPELKLEKAACGGGLHIRSPAYYKTFFDKPGLPAFCSRLEAADSGRVNTTRSRRTPPARAARRW